VSAVIGAAAQTVSSASATAAQAVSFEGTGASQNAKGVTSKTVAMWTRVHVGLIKELVRIQGEQYSQWHDHVARWCASEWNKCKSKFREYITLVSFWFR
jgi:hypothetical protein